MSDSSLENYLATQSTATVTLLGVVAYLVHELTRTGTLNREHFDRHLEDLDAPDGPNESAEERRMRKSIITMVRKAAATGLEDGASD